MLSILFKLLRDPDALQRDPDALLRDPEKRAISNISPELIRLYSNRFSYLKIPLSEIDMRWLVYNS